MDSTNQSVAAQQGSHFFRITLQSYNPHTTQLRTADRSGTFTPDPGETRLDVYNEIRRLVGESDPSLAKACVLSFDLVPNQL